MSNGFGRRQHGVMLDALFDTDPLYQSLHTGDPGKDGQTANEVSTTLTGYEAVAVPAATWGDAAEGASAVMETKNDNDTIDYPKALLDWTTTPDRITHSALWTHQTLRTEQYFVGRGYFQPAVQREIKRDDEPSFALNACAYAITETAD